MGPIHDASSAVRLNEDFSHDPPTALRPFPPQRSGVGTASAVAANSVRPRILLAEDDNDLRALMRAFLENDGYHVLPCGDGRRALQTFREGTVIDLLITDLQMPHLTGGELALALSARRPSLPIILMSGAEVPEELRVLIDARSWVFIQKPFPVPDMLAAVHETLQPYRGSGQTARRSA